MKRNQLQQLVAGAAQVGAQAAAGAAQVGAQDDVPQVAGAQQRGLQRRIFGMQSFGMQTFGILNEWQRGLQQLLQDEATGAQVATGAQLATGAAQVGAHVGAQLATGAAHVGAQAGAQAAAGAAQVGAAETHAAGAAQLGTELQLLQLLWWNRPAWALFRLAKAASAAEIQTNFIAFSRFIMGRGNGLN